MARAFCLYLAIENKIAFYLIKTIKIIAIMKSRARLQLMLGTAKKVNRLKQKNRNLAYRYYKLQQINQQLNSLLQKEKEAKHKKLRLMSMAAHEFRTPLASILSSAELLHYYSEKLSNEERQNLVKQVEKAAEQMTQLLDNLLVLNKIECDNTPFQPVSLNLENLCRDIVSEIKLTANENQNITFTFKGNSTSVVMDDKLIRHILNNLLSNAIKYSPNGGTVELLVICQDGQALFVVKDSGIGIPVADREKLFESFYRASNVGKINGTGLGLSIVKQMVDLHSGSITVDSEVGFGTTFTVSLPLRS